MSLPHKSFGGVAETEAGNSDLTHRSLGIALQGLATARRLRVLMALAVAMSMLMFVALGWYEYSRTARDAQNALGQANLIVHEHAVKVFESNEVVLDRIMDVLGDKSTGALHKDEKTLHSMLVQMTSGFDQIRNVMLWNEEGRPVLSSRYYPLPWKVTVADRPFFIRHKKQGLRFSINEPVDGRLGQDRIFNISKVRKHRDGRFGGVVSISFSPQYFSDFYRRVVGDDHHLAITLFTEDGEVVSRYPIPVTSMKLGRSNPLMGAVQAGAGHGFLSAVPGVDGQLRYAAFRKVSSYPLYVAVSRSHASVFAEWRHDTLVAALFIFPGSLVLIFAIWLASKRAEMEHEAILRCHDEEVRRRAVEDQVRQLHKFEALGQLTSGLAHDFNNLLHIISTNAAIIGVMPPHMDKKRHLAAVNHAVSSAQALTTHLLAFARKKTLTLECASPASIVPDMCDLARHSLPKTIELRCEIRPDVWNINVDRSELELAIINMAVNARDAMEGRGVITVTVRNVPMESRERTETRLPARDFVALSVCDTGSGIPESLLHQVFEPFFTTKKDGTGTGLGLSRVYAYALQLGGTAVAENAPDRGAVITVYVPRSDALAVTSAKDHATLSGIAIRDTRPTPAAPDYPNGH